MNGTLVIRRRTAAAVADRFGPATARAPLLFSGALGVAAKALTTDGIMPRPAARGSSAACVNRPHRLR